MCSSCRHHLHFFQLPTMRIYANRIDSKPEAAVKLILGMSQPESLGRMFKSEAAIHKIKRMKEKLVVLVSR